MHRPLLCCCTPTVVLYSTGCCSSCCHHGAEAYASSRGMALMADMYVLGAAGMVRELVQLWKESSSSSTVDQGKQNMHNT